MLTKCYRTWVEHVTNPLHVYCRLIDVGLSVKVSRRLSVFYEKFLYSSMVKDQKVKWSSFKKRYS